jgi:hypothetical protein
VIALDTPLVAIRRAEAAGVVLRLDGGVVRLTAPAAPPPEVVAALRRHREAVVAILAERAARPCGWLESIADAVRCAVAEGAVREADHLGWLSLVRPDGRRLAVAPHVVGELRALGMLPSLTKEESANDRR